MDKFQVVGAIVDEITAVIASSRAAAEEARVTATNKENVAENKYDTLGLEAAYLAHGQSERVLQLENDLAAYNSLKDRLADHDVVAIGSLVQLDNESAESRFLFIGPESGGLSINVSGVAVTVITPGSPLGKALLGSGIDDEVSIGASEEKIAALW